MHRRFIRVPAVLTAAVILTVGVAEWVFRAFPQIMLPQWEILRHHSQLDAYALDSVPDPDIGFRWKPDQVVNVRTDDFQYVLRTDHQGFSNIKTESARADIVILGDSLVESEGVDLEAGFPSRVESGLRGQSVVNLAVTAAGPERQYRIYRRFGRQLHPKTVIASWYPASDLDNDESFNAWLRDGRGVDYEYFRRHGNSSAPPGEKRLSLHRRLLRESWLYGNAHEMLRRYMGRSSPPQESHRFPSAEEVLFDGKALAFAVNRAPGATTRVDEAMKSLGRLRSLVEGDGARLIVMLIPSKEELFASGAAPTGPPEVVELRRRLHESGVEVLDLYPSLRAAGQKASPYFRRNIHLNHFGHTVVASEIISHLRR